MPACATWRDSLELLAARGVALARLGRRDETRAIEARIATLDARRWGRGLPHRARAHLAAHLGETERALALAEEAVARGALSALGGLRTIDSDPFLLPLRGDARFRALAGPASEDGG